METVVKKILPLAVLCAQLTGIVLSSLLISCSPFSGDGDSGAKVSQSGTLRDGAEVLARDENGNMLMARIESYGPDGVPVRVFSYWRELGAPMDSAIFNIDTLSYSADGKLVASKSRSWRSVHPETPTLIARTYTSWHGEPVPATEKTSWPSLPAGASSSSASFTFAASADGTSDTLRARFNYGSVDTTLWRRLRLRYEDSTEETAEQELIPIIDGRTGGTILIMRSSHRFDHKEKGKVVRSTSAAVFGAILNQSEFRYTYSGDRLESVVLAYPLGQTSEGKYEYKQLSFEAEIRKLLPGTPVD